MTEDGGIHSDLKLIEELATAHMPDQGIKADGTRETELDRFRANLWSFSALTAYAINDLSAYSCGPAECAPCEALQNMHERGDLDDILRPYVSTSGANWDWWDGDAKTGRLRWEWVTDRWTSEA